VRAQLDCDCAVYGSYRREGERLFLRLEAIEARSGRLLLVREAATRMADFLGGTDGAVGALAGALHRALTDRATDIAGDRPLAETESYALLLAGIARLFALTRPEFRIAGQHFAELAERHPDAASVHAWRGLWHVLSATQSVSADCAEAGRAARDMTARALDIDGTNAFALTVDGMAHTMLLQRFDIAERRYHAAVEHAPSTALAWLLSGGQLAFTGHGERAVAATTRARALSPLDPYRHFFDTVAASAHISAGDLQGALALADRARADNPAHLSTLRTRAIALQMMGREAEARAAVQDLLVRAPDATVSKYRARHPACAYPAGRAWAEALRAAGLPD
jgi:tetratricopeptide (TPR) repeat protein